MGMASLAYAGEASWDISSNLQLTSRTFSENASWLGQDDRSTQFSLSGSSELRWRRGNQRASIMPYLRWDDVDEERSLADFREAYWAVEADSFEVLVGVNTVFWGVTESVHLVDVINQTDAVADIDGEDKLGQPMINLELQRNWGRIGFYLLPYFRERTFAGIDGRLRTPAPVDTENALFESSDEENHVDVALRYSHYQGNFDIGLSAFKGTGREPDFLPGSDNSGLLPVYFQIEQFGIDLQYTGDAWLWKLEGVHRQGHFDSYQAMVGGFEYTAYQIVDSNADIGILLEYQYDGRDDREPLTLADNDLFAGVRLALNDIQDSNLLAGAGYDTKSGETFVTIEAERRLGNHFVLELQMRLFTRVDASDTMLPIKNDDYLQLSLSRYF